MSRKKNSHPRPTSGINANQPALHPRGLVGRWVMIGGLLVCVVALVVARTGWWRYPAAGDPTGLARRAADSVNRTSPGTSPPGALAEAEPSTDESTLDPERADVDTTDLGVDEPLAMSREQLQEVRQLASSYPEDQNAVYLLGLVLHEQGDIDEAIATWRRCLELNPKRSDLYDSLGRAYSRKGDLPQAVEMFRTALDFQPNAIETRARLAESLLQQGEIQQVVAVLDTDLGTNPNARLVLGQALQQLEDHDKAREQFQEAVAIQPDLAQAYYGLAVSCAALGRNDEAQANQEKFLELENVRQQAGRDPLRPYDAADSSRSRLADSLSDVGRVYQSLRDHREAERLWLRAATVDPENSRCREYLASLYQEEKRFSDSLRYRAELSRLEPDRAIHYFHLGNMNLVLKQFNAAAEAYQKVVELEPNRVDGYQALAQCYLLSGRNLDEALELARKALRLSPEPPVYALLGRLYEKNGDIEGAVNAMQQAVHLDPSNQEYRRIYEALQRKK